MNNRKKIPEKLRRSVLLEAGHRCAIPTCKQTPVEVAHIIPWNECKEHEFHNLIALCPTCHARYDRGQGKEIDRRSMQAYKSNLSLINSRYSAFEIRVMKKFMDKDDYELWLPESLNILIWYLIEDKIIEDTTGTPLFGTSGVGMNRKYQLKDKGRELLKKWQEAELIE